MPFPVQSLGADWPRYPAQRLQRFPRSRDAASSSAALPVDVERTAALLASIADAARDVPTVDRARVGALRQALAAGTMSVDPYRIAGSAVAFDALLG